MSDIESKIIAADAFHASNKIRENYDLLNELFKEDTKNPELLWRLARANYDLAVETTKKEDSQLLTEKGLELINEAKEKIPDNFNVYKWQGILLGKKGDFLATKEKIANAFIIRDNFKKAIELNPKDSTSQFCMAKWCWSILQVGWMERQAASLLFGTPPTSTYEECEKYLQDAWALNQEGVHTALLLGDLYYQQKKYPDAKKWFDTAATCPAVTDNQKRQVDEAKTKSSKC
eukprot:GILI01011345.1.p1 GENE.GILI01011345.1~~GILI01011345.1.p1  ORF type:complete len:240 (-),score=63.52 GILI01011345.1:58-753(-)